MAATAQKRLLTEYKNLTNDSPEGIIAGPRAEDDMFHWDCLIQGPEGTPFEGGVFPATLTFPKDYPLAPPTMKFECDMWHPNGTLVLQSLFQTSDCLTYLRRGLLFAESGHKSSALPSQDPMLAHPARHARSKANISC